jgi:O-antigen/teichoic acid export membrane protein
MARAVAWNAAARWISQVVSWTSTIVVARLLTPYDYGLVGMAGLYLQLAMLVSQAGIGDTVIAMRDLTRRQIAELNTFSIILGVILVGLSCALARPLAHFFSAPPLFLVIVVGSGVYLINAFQTIPRAILQRELRFKLLAGIETARAFSQVIATMLFAWLKFGYWSLVIGYVVSSATATALIFLAKQHEFAIPHPTDLKRELKFGAHVLVSRVASYVYENADFGIAGRVLGETALGDYTVAWTISSAPVEKIGNLITGVTPAFFSAVQTDKTELRRYLLRLTELLSLVTVPASIGLALSADYLVPILLGSKWYGVIGPLRLLGLFVAVRSLATILPQLLTAIGDARFVMWATACAAVAMPIAFLIGSRWGTVGIAAAWVIAFPLIIGPIYHRVFHVTGLSLRKYLSAITPALSSSAVMAIVVMFTRALLSHKFHPILGLVMITISGVLSYAGSLFVFHRWRITSLVRSVRNTFQTERVSERS